MTQRDLNRITMWKVVYQYLQNNHSIWKDNEGFAEAVADLHRWIEAAEAVAGRQASGTTGITSDKDELADKAIAATLKVTRVARAYARKGNNQTLLEAVDYDKGILQKTPFDELATRLTSMLTAATAVKGELGRFGFIAGSDEVAAAAIASFRAAAAGTRIAISARSAATATAPQILKGGKAELLVLDDLVHLYDEDEPEFVGAYKVARNVVDAGIRHEGAAAEGTPAV